MWKDFNEKARQNAGFRAFQIFSEIWKECGRITISIRVLCVKDDQVVLYKSKSQPHFCGWLLQILIALSRCHRGGKVLLLESYHSICRKSTDRNITVLQALQLGTFFQLYSPSFLNIKIRPVDSAHPVSMGRLLPRAC